MDDLKACFKNMGFDDVKTVFTSGNVILNSNENEECLKDKISRELVKYYSYDIDIFVKSLINIEAIINNNPFKVEKGYYNQVFICNDDFGKKLFELFSDVELIDKEEIAMVDDVLYWKYIKDESRLSSNILRMLSKNSLKHGFTLRTIGTLKSVLKTSR